MTPQQQYAYLTARNPMEMPAALKMEQIRLTLVCQGASPALASAGQATTTTTTTTPQNQWNASEQQSISEAATQDSWAHAATGATHDTAVVLSALINGQFGTQAAQLAHDGQVQAAMIAAQQHSEDNVIETQRLALAARELALREAAAANTPQISIQHDTATGGVSGGTGVAAVPKWVWISGGVAALAAAGGITYALMRGGKKSSSRGTKNPCNCK
jgi:hypothetical protein